MHLDYEFELNGNIYNGVGVNIGDTCNIEIEKKNIEENQKAAICHEFDLTYGSDNAKIEKIYQKAIFKFCDLY